MKKYIQIKKILLGSRKPFFFSEKKQKISIFSDKYELKADEIDLILKKNVKKCCDDPNHHHHDHHHQTLKHPHENKQEEKEKLKEFFSQKINYEISDRFFGDSPQKADKNTEVLKENSENVPETTKTKYGLPIRNIEIANQEQYIMESEKMEETPNMRLMDVLKITADTPYETYELELQKKFNFGS